MLLGKAVVVTEDMLVLYSIGLFGLGGFTDSFQGQTSCVEGPVGLFLLEHSQSVS